MATQSLPLTFFRVADRVIWPFWVNFAALLSS